MHGQQVGESGIENVIWLKPDGARMDDKAWGDPLARSIALLMCSPALASFAPGASSQDRSTVVDRSEEHTSELKSLMRNSYAVFFLKKKTQNGITHVDHNN